MSTEFFEGEPDLLLVGEIRRERDRVGAAGGAEALDRVRQPFPVACQHCHAGPLGGERQGSGEPHAGGATVDDDRRPGQAQIHSIKYTKWRTGSSMAWYRSS